MLKNLLIKTLESKAKALYKENKNEIIDIILFGSILNGKEKPNDIDILIIFKEKKNLQKSYEFKKDVESQTKILVDINSITYTDLFTEVFQPKEAILSEGYSLVNKISISNGFGYQNKIMFIYQLQKKNKSERMKFYYSLYGRKSEGMLKILNATKLTDTIIIGPIENKEKLREYLDNWSISYKMIPILIPRRITV